MSLYSTCLQTLSEMAILENSIEIPKETPNTIVEELMETIRNLPYLTEEQAVFDVSMIPLKEDRDTNRIYLEMEDLYRYMASNKIQSITEAIGNILEYNDCTSQFHRLALIIDEQSILDEIASLGYNIDNDTWDKTPPKGLGIPLAVETHTDFDNIRKIANTKQLMDTLTGRYGLPLIKRHYTKVGLLDSAEINNKESVDEDAMPKINSDSKILHEKPKSNNNSGIDIEKEQQSKNIGNNLNENAEMNPREMKLQIIKDIASGKYDDVEDSVFNELTIVAPPSTKEALIQGGTGAVGAYAGHKLADKMKWGKIGHGVARAIGWLGGNALAANRHKIMGKINNMRIQNSPRFKTTVQTREVSEKDLPSWVKK